MEDLLAALTDSGWRLLDRQEHPRASRDPFRLEGDRVTWAIIRGDSSPVVELEFHAFGDLGQRTEKLNDILYCIVAGTTDRLYFDKRAKPEWRENLSSFVRILNERAEH